MAKEITRGEIWLVSFPKPDKRRPVLVLSRQTLIEVLNTVTVCAITSQRRGAPTEVDIGEEDGLKAPSTANLINLFTVRQADLQRYIGRLTPAKMRFVCAALAVSVGCD